MPLPIDLVTLNKHPITGRERRFSRLVLFVEDIIKVPMFRCKHCGECLLCSTAFICPQNCPKQLRNGPCGGTRENGSCEVYPDRKCVWYRIYVRSKKLRRISLLYRINKVHDWNLEGTSAWLNLFKKRIDAPILLVRNDTQKVRDIISDDITRENRLKTVRSVRGN